MRYLNLGGSLTGQPFTFTSRDASGVSERKERLETEKGATACVRDLVRCLYSDPGLPFMIVSRAGLPTLKNGFSMSWLYAVVLPGKPPKLAMSCRTPAKFCMRGSRLDLGK